MFHIRDGWSFRRLNGGEVRLLKRYGTAADEYIEATFTAAEWCAIVASVSRTGETIESFTDAQFVHMGKLKTVPPKLLQAAPAPAPESEPEPAVK